MNSTPTFIRKPVVVQRTSLTERMIDRRVLAGTFPKPALLSARQPVWIEAEVATFIAQRIADRDAGVLPPKRQSLLESRRRGGLKAAARRAAARRPVEPPNSTSSLPQRNAT